MFEVMTVRAVLKVPFEEAASPSLPLLRSGTLPTALMWVQMLCTEKQEQKPQ